MPSPSAVLALIPTRASTGSGDAEATLTALPQAPTQPQQSTVTYQPQQTAEIGGWWHRRFNIQHWLHNGMSHQRVTPRNFLRPPGKPLTQCRPSQHRSAQKYWLHRQHQSRNCMSAQRQGKRQLSLNVIDNKLTKGLTSSSKWEKWQIITKLVTLFVNKPANQILRTPQFYPRARRNTILDCARATM